MSPEGTRIVYQMRSEGGGTALAARRLDQPKAVILPDTANATQPFFSPDGQWIGFTADQKLKKISVEGGAAVTLCDAQNMRGAAWSADGNIYTTIGLRNCSASPQPAVRRSSSPTWRNRANTRTICIAGRRFCLGNVLLVSAGSNAKAGGWDEANIEVFSFKTGQFKIVQHGGYFGRYLPSGHLVYVHQGILFAVPFSLEHLETHGTPAPILDDVAGSKPTAGGQFDFGRRHPPATLVYLSGKTSAETLPAVWLDADGRKQPLWSSPPGPSVSPRLSPDGSSCSSC